MLTISIDTSSRIPLYMQIVDQVKQAVAHGDIDSGSHLPTIRDLAAQLKVNVGTVARAYRELVQQNVVMSRSGGGSVVLPSSDASSITRYRESRLFNIVEKGILDALSQGYSAPEIDAAFHLQLTRWREDSRKVMGTVPEELPSIERGEHMIRIVASNDLVLNMLVSRIKEGYPSRKINLTFVGSLGGLIALQQGRADVAGIHLLDEETMEYNYPYMKHLLPGRQVAVIHLAVRTQGLICARGNPRGIHVISDLARHGIRIVNRQQGSGTRLLLDLGLKKEGISPEDINGYENEVTTHAAVASMIDKGEADAGLGVEVAAKMYELDFIPLLEERYDLVTFAEDYKSALMEPLLSVLSDSRFKETVAGVPGYDISQMGMTIFYT